MKIRNVKTNVENKININGSTWSSTPTMNFEKEGVGVDDHIDPFKDKGITLIALIITIIIMLILAGVVISLTIGENGLFKTAKYAVVKTEEEKAKEKLELALADLTAHKYTNSDYDEKGYINNYLSKEGMIVIEDIVIVDGWKFSIDRSVPKIVESLGKGEESKKITITANVENASDYTKATIKIEIAYEGTIKEIKINGQEQEIPEKNEEGKYVILKEVTSNGKYTIYVKEETDEYKTGLANVTEISEDMDIKNADDLVAFRDRVNKGATYSGRTINVINNIDLSTVCYKVDGTIENDKSFEPIGNYQEEGENSTHKFKGTFNGNYHKIQGLYINTDKDYQGLFGLIENATIIGVVIDGIKDKEAIDEDTKITSIKGNNFVGAISGYMINNSTIQNCGNNAKIVSTGLNGGGIVGEIENSNLEGCYNKADVTATGGFAGGIIGAIYYTEEGEYYLKNSYNEGSITGGSFVGGITGDSYGDNNSNISAIFSNCYNKGIITGTNDGRVGGITGRNNGKVSLEYCFNLGGIDNTGGTAVGGLVGINRLPANATSDICPTINYCYNIANVISTGTTTGVGGLVGINNQYAYIKNCCRLATAEVKNGSIVSGFGKYGTSSNSYTGRLIGSCHDQNTPYIDNVYNETAEYIPTVYNVVNGLSDDESAYWSSTNVNAPKLLWESNVK